MTLRRKTPLRPKCSSGKRRYKDRIAAELALASAQKTDGSRRAKLERRAYKCPSCGGWHLTALASWSPSRAPLPKASAKRRKQAPARRQLVAALLAEQPWCQRCQAARSTDVHEPRMRSRGADICDRAQCVALCRACHDWAHANPAAATEEGWLIPSWTH